MHILPMSQKITDHQLLFLFAFTRRVFFCFHSHSSCNERCMVHRRWNAGWFQSIFESGTPSGRRIPLLNTLDLHICSRLTSLLMWTPPHIRLNKLLGSAESSTDFESFRLERCIIDFNIKMR